MPTLTHPPKVVFPLLLVLTTAALTACGGGGDGAGSGATDASAAAAPSAPSSAAALATRTTTSVGSVVTPPGASTAVVEQLAATTKTQAVNQLAVAALPVLSAGSTVAVSGVAETPSAATPVATSTGRALYLDSVNGNDANDGLAATTSGGRGPWRTLTRLRASDVGPGDTVRLACNSVWNESLGLPRSGTATSPIVVTAASGCTTPPSIEGSVAVSAWTRHQGNVFKASVSGTVLLLTSDSNTPWIEAHHPNRGYLPNQPTSPYLTTAAASPIGTLYGQPVSSTIETGVDLQLPAGASIGAGARARIRVYSWSMQDRTIGSVTGGRITLTQPTWYPLGAGWGYMLMGQQWMVDSQGEWYHDTATGTLYAYSASASGPSGVRAATLNTGIDLSGRANITVDGLTVRRVATGADLRGTSNVSLRNMRFSDIADIGTDATTSTNATIDSCLYARTGTDTISGWRHDGDASTGLKVLNNVIRDSGVIMQGEEVQSLPRSSYAAIYGGLSSTISGNTVINSGYIGIQAQANSFIERNFVYGACSVLDDCAGIYTQYANNNSVIRGNTVVHSRGTTIGKPAAEATTAAQGIYLDESVTGALVEGNTVVDTDNGIQLHVSSHNTVRGNKLYGNRRTQIWLQSNRNVINATGDLQDNTIVDNLIAPLVTGATGIWVDTLYASASVFGIIDRNRYFDRVVPGIVTVRTASLYRTYTLPEWRSATDPTLPAGRDVNGWSSNGTAFASYSVADSSVVPNGMLQAGLSGWTSWNATAPAVRMVREGCSAGTCLRYVPGGSRGLVSSPYFSVQQGQWYRLTVDLMADRDNQTTQLIVRRGNGDYEQIGASDFTVPVARGWRRFSAVFQSAVGITANDIGTVGTRIDVAPTDATVSVSLANLELVRITPGSIPQTSSIVTNASNVARAMNCPVESTQPSLCSKFRNLADDSLVAWPLTLPANSSAMIYAQEPNLIDSDLDGIADVQDTCPGTIVGVPVNALGCPLTLP